MVDPGSEITHDGNNIVIKRIMNFWCTLQYFSISRIPNVHIYIVASYILIKGKIIWFFNISQKRFINIVHHLSENHLFFTQSHFSKQWYDSTLLQQSVWIISQMNIWISLWKIWQQQSEKTEHSSFHARSATVFELKCLKEFVLLAEKVKIKLWQENSARKSSRKLEEEFGCERTCILTFIK